MSPVNDPQYTSIDDLERSLEAAIEQARQRFDTVTQQIEQGLHGEYPTPSHLHEEHAYRAGWLHALEAVLKRLRGESDTDPEPAR